MEIIGQIDLNQPFKIQLQRIDAFRKQTIAVRELLSKYHIHLILKLALTKAIYTINNIR